MRFRWGGNFARVVPPSIDRKRRREAASFPRLSNTASRIAFRARTRELDSFFSLSTPFIRLLLIFFPPLFVEILFCFFRAWTQRNRYTRNGVWWFLILRGTVCDGNRRLWKEDTIRNTSKTTFHRHRAVRFSTILWIPYRKRLSNYRSSSNGRRNEEFRIVDSLSQLKPRSEIRSLFVTDALTQLPWPIYAFTWYYASVADDGQRCESIASEE